MRGSIRKRGATYTIYWDDYSTGVRKQRSKGGFKTKKEAEKAINEMLTKLEKGELTELTKMTLESYLDYWVENSAKNKWAKTTLQRNMISINKYLIPNLGHIQLAKLNPLIAQEFYTKAIKPKEDGGYELQPSTVKLMHKVLNNALLQAVKWRLIINNPLVGIELPKVSKTNITILDENEGKKLLSELEGTLFYMPVFLALNTGMRRGEVLGLKWPDIDFKNQKISVNRGLQKANNIVFESGTKTNSSSRTITLSNNMIEVLKEHKKNQAKQKLLLGPLYIDNQYVSCKEDGAPLDPTYFSNIFRSIVNKLGFQLTFHDLRHTHATLLLKANIHPKVVADRLGHSNVSITLNTYSHVLPNIQKEAAEIMDKIL